MSLQIDRLRKSYGDLVAVDDVSWRLAPGSLTAVLGPSGCGKSTTLEMIAGLVTPDAGTVSIGGTDVTRLAPERRPVSLVFQKPLLFPHLSVERNVGFGLRMRREPRSETAHRVAAMLERVQLANLGSRRVQELSGGQEQRVSLARALVLRPDLLLLDEPFSQLDAGLRVEMRALVRTLHDESGQDAANPAVTTVFVTHDQAEAVDLADEIVVMLDGRVAAQATPADLFAAPPSLAVARFLGTTNEVVGRVERGLFSPFAVPVPQHDDGPAVLTIRPEAVHVASNHPQAVPMTVETVHFAGAHLTVTLDAGRDERLTAHAPIGTPLSVGSTTGVHLPPQRCVLFGDDR